MDLFRFIWPIGIGVDDPLRRLLVSDSGSAIAEKYLLVDENGNPLLDENGKYLIEVMKQEKIATYLTEENGNVLSTENGANITIKTDGG